jgi:hypothetical protein
MRVPLVLLDKVGLVHVERKDRDKGTKARDGGVGLLGFKQLVV